MVQDFYYYKEAQKLGQKEYRAKTAKGESPYLPVLDELIPPEKAMGGTRLGVIQIPLSHIVGTKTSGRMNSSDMMGVHQAKAEAGKEETP